MTAITKKSTLIQINEEHKYVLFRKRVAPMQSEYI